MTDNKCKICSGDANNYAWKEHNRYTGEWKYICTQCYDDGARPYIVKSARELSNAKWDFRLALNTLLYKGYIDKDMHDSIEKQAKERCEWLR